MLRRRASTELLDISEVIEIPARFSADYVSSIGIFGDVRVIATAYLKARRVGKSLPLSVALPLVVGTLCYWLIRDQAYPDQNTKMYVELIVRSTLTMNGYELSDDVNGFRNLLIEIENGLNLDEVKQQFQAFCKPQRTMIK